MKAEISDVPKCLFVYRGGFIYIYVFYFIFLNLQSPLIEHVAAFLSDPYCLVQILFGQAYTSIQGLEPNTTEAT